MRNESTYGDEVSCGRADGCAVYFGNQIQS